MALSPARLAPPKTSMKYLQLAIQALTSLCMALQNNPNGAKHLVAIAAIGAVVYVLHWVNS
jgi:hypothetical protein